MRMKIIYTEWLEEELDDKKPQNLMLGAKARAFLRMDYFIQNLANGTKIKHYQHRDWCDKCNWKEYRTCFDHL